MQAHLAVGHKGKVDDVQQPERDSATAAKNSNQVCLLTWRLGTKAKLMTWAGIHSLRGGAAAAGQGLSSQGMQIGMVCQTTRQHLFAVHRLLAGHGKLAALALE
jgi:hypothetical protein